MKTKMNKLLLLLLAAALIFSLASATALAEDHTHDGYIEWTETTSLPPATSEGGSYYLTADVTLSSTWQVSQNVDLCLNGYGITYTGSGSAIQVLNNTLNLYDCGETEHSFSVDSKGLAVVGDGSESFTGGYITTTQKTNPEVLNQLGGVHVEPNGTLNMYGGTVLGFLGTHGGAVRIHGTFNMSGGRICYNVATSHGGAGVRVLNRDTHGTMTLSGDAKIDHNRATNGSTGSGKGGGIWVDETCTLTMTGGEVKDNESTNQNGGGIYVDKDATLNLSGGSVTGNTAAKNGGGIYVLGTMNLSGSAEISRNKNDNAENNVYLDTGKKINVTDDITEDTNIGITQTTSDIGKAFTSGLTTNGDGNATHFFSDNPAYGVTLVEGGQDAGEAILATAYDITVTGGNAYRTVNDEEPITSEAAGNYVYLKPTPVAGKYVTGWKISYGDSEELIPVPGDLGVGVFEMPYAPDGVSVEAVYADQQEYVIDLTGGEKEIETEAFAALQYAYELANPGEESSGNDSVYSLLLDADDTADIVIEQRVMAGSDLHYYASKAAAPSIDDYIFNANKLNTTKYWPIKIVFKNYDLEIVKTWNDHSDAGGRRPADLQVTAAVAVPITADTTYVPGEDDELNLIATFTVEEEESSTSIENDVKDISAWQNSNMPKDLLTDLGDFVFDTLERIYFRSNKYADVFFSTGYTTTVDGESYAIWGKFKSFDADYSVEPSVTTTVFELYFIEGISSTIPVEYQTEPASATHVGEWTKDGDTWTYKMEITPLATEALVWEALPEYYLADKGTSEDDAVTVDLTQVPASTPAATVELTNYRETYTVTVINGMATAYGTTARTVQAVEGETVRLAADSIRDFTFKKWLVMSGNAELNNIESRLTSFKMPAEDVELFAVITKENSGSSAPAETNDVIVTDPDNGDVSVDPDEAKEGEVVTITPEPDAGYEVDEVKVYDEDGKEVPVKDNGDGTYSFTMPDGPVKVDVSFKDKDGFSDVGPNDWFYDAVLYAVDNGLMYGVGGDLFAPNAPTTRAMIVTILYRLEGETDVEGLPPFSDTVPREWYIYGVKWASDNGIVAGFPDGTFKPDELITREQFAAILYRYAQFKGYDVSVGQDTNILSFNDAFEVSDWANAAVCWAVGAGLMMGDDKGNLNPQAPASRAEAAALFQRFAEKVK